MNTYQVDTQIKQLIERQINAWETANPEEIISDFSEDALFIAPGSTWTGKLEIKEATETYFAQFTVTQIIIKRLIVSGKSGAIEWTWNEKSKETGETSQAEDAIIFELEGETIKYWREYIDKNPQES
ncbi:MAG TPA: nuclear transport factor 2 family protein [Coleofasciculaceae cyanobacterium]